MQSSRFVLIVALLPALIGTSFQREKTPRTEGEKRSELVIFTIQLDLVIRSQIDEIADLLPSARIAQLRRDYESWKAARDAECARQGRISSDPLAELECRSIEMENYYQKLELELMKLESERDNK